MIIHLDLTVNVTSLLDEQTEVTSLIDLLDMDTTTTLNKSTSVTTNIQMEVD